MFYQLRKAVLEANLALVTHKLVVFTWGNVSAIDRKSGIVAIKPSGVAYDNMTLNDIVLLDLKGKVVSGTLKPSSDTPTHLAIYNGFGDVGAVVHTHSPWATSWAQAGRSIPIYGTTHADYFYGHIPCTRSMTQEETRCNYEQNTGKLIVDHMHAHDPATMPGILVKGHGPFCWGNSAIEAVHNAVVMEELAKTAFYTESLGNKTPIEKHLIDKHFLRKHGDSAYYGQ